MGISVLHALCRGPCSIRFQAGNTIELQDVIIGEVGIRSGQSNMEWSSFSKLPEIITEIPRSTNPELKRFHTPRATSPIPKN